MQRSLAEAFETSPQKKKTAAEGIHHGGWNMIEAPRVVPLSSSRGKSVNHEKIKSEFMALVFSYSYFEPYPRITHATRLQTCPSTPCRVGIDILWINMLRPPEIPMRVIFQVISTHVALSENMLHCIYLYTYGYMYVYAYVDMDPCICIHMYI